MASVAGDGLSTGSRHEGFANESALMVIRLAHQLERPPMQLLNRGSQVPGIGVLFQLLRNEALKLCPALCFQLRRLFPLTGGNRVPDCFGGGQQAF